HVESISLDKTELEMVAGDKTTLSASVLPADAENKSVTWSTSDESIASVNKNGKVSAISAGKVTITATTVDGGFTASCSVNVSTKVVPVTGISLDQDSVDFAVGETKQLVATVLPSSASNKGVTWSSTNEAVVTVSETGLLTAVSAGSAIVTVKTDDGGYQEYCIVSVSE
ncbi:MAG: Ig domain-containing protein, partial [Bacilli bacterium]|nr:Ig domain-containing protein [Bacilli bacterium]